MRPPTAAISPAPRSCLVKTLATSPRTFRYGLALAFRAVFSNNVIPNIVLHLVNGAAVGGNRQKQFLINSKEGKTMDILRLILAIFIPPLGVFLQVGIGPQFWLNVLLTLLGYLPGIIHAVWIILSK